MKEGVISVEREWFNCDTSVRESLNQQFESFLSFYIRLHKMSVIL